MKLFPPEPEIDLYNVGFGTEDLFERKIVGQRLSKLFEQIDQPMVVALDGAWGTGKTHFLKRWVGAHRLENDGRATTIYFDAFAHDFLDDPLLALTGVIGDRLTKGEERKTWSKVKSAAYKLARPAARVALSAATFGASELANSLGDTAIEAVGKELENATVDFWKRENGRRQAMLDFKAALSSLASQGQGPDSEPYRLIVVVDELDRCRPDFALGLLEVAKHFFSVPNVHFLLGVNHSALVSCVGVRYGSGINGEEYLRRFISMFVRLPDEIGLDGTGRVPLVYFQATSKSMAIPSELSGRFHVHLGMRLRSSSVSMRDLGRLLTQIAILATRTDLSGYLFGYRDLVVSMILFRQFDPELYEKAKNGSASLSEIRAFYGISALNLKPSSESGIRYHHPSFLISGLWEFVISNGSQPADSVRDFSRALDSFGSVEDANTLPASIARKYVETFEIGEL